MRSKEVQNIYGKNKRPNPSSAKSVSRDIVYFRRHRTNTEQYMVR